MGTKRFIRLLVALPLILLATQGCGLLYTNVVRSESRDFKNTPIGTKSFSMNAYRIQIPLFLPFNKLTRASAEWDTNKINELAAKVGMTKIYFTDFKTKEILLGTLRRQTIIVYGD